jgi:hypothetical protein
VTKAAGRTADCGPEIRRGRLAKARQFLAAADTVLIFSDDDLDLSDAYVTLCVHAGIAAADAICCALLGKHAIGESHGDAVGLLETASKDAARHLDTLLKLKTRSGYGATPSTSAARRQAGRAAAALLEVAEAVA